MKLNYSKGYTVFSVFNYSFLFIMALLCVFPLLHVLALSMSSTTAASSGRVWILPVEFNLKSYGFVIQNKAFIKAFGVSLKRVALGIPVNMFLTILTAYPLSRRKSQFRMKTFFTWFFLITMLFGGGLIPWYMVIQQVWIMDTIWALILPGAVPVFNVILLMNFFREVPLELEEAAHVDGASHIYILTKVFLPLALPTLTTILLFSLLSHWNSWFDGLILMNSPDKYPLQSYMQTILINRDPTSMTQQDLDLLKIIDERTTRSAQIFIAMIPIIMVYPFLQKYFTKGLVVGAIKG